MPRFAHRLLLIAAFAALTGCGQMGPLYLPDEEPVTSETEDPALVAPGPSESAEPFEDEL